MAECTCAAKLVGDMVIQKIAQIQSGEKVGLNLASPRPQSPDPALRSLVQTSYASHSGPPGLTYGIRYAKSHLSSQLSSE